MRPTAEYPSEQTPSVVDSLEEGLRNPVVNEVFSLLCFFGGVGGVVQAGVDLLHHTGHPLIDIGVSAMLFLGSEFFHQRAQQQFTPQVA